MNTFTKIGFACLFLFLSSFAFGQDFVYTPKNPAFGGDTFNYNWLLSSAQIQDLTEDPNALQFGNTRSTADSFAQSLNNLILSQLSREIITTQFGEDGFTDGTYELGEFQIDVATTLEGLTITVLDLSQGEQTQIVIPFF
ncbi:MAG: curli production assembly/transport component CsgF [Bacteroidota bacterium]